MLRKLSKTEAGQTMVEYTIVIGLIVVILFAMSPMIKRGSQGMIKLVVDQIGKQENAEQINGVGEQFLNESYITTQASIEKRTQELLGSTRYSYNESTHTLSNALIDMGFTER